MAKAELSGKKKIYEACSSYIIGTLENAFYRLGFSVSCSPWKTIIVSWIVVGICSLGMVNFYQEKHPLKLWVPPDSTFVKDTYWLLKQFGEGFRSQNVLIVGADVLQPEVLKQMFDIDKKIKQITSFSSEGSNNWNGICFKIPIIANLKRQKRSLNMNMNKTDLMPTFNDDFFGDNFDDGFEKDRDFDPSVDLDTDTYCSIVNQLEMGCLQQNILDIWSYREEIVANLTKDRIVNDLHNTKISPVLGHATDYLSLLGELTYNDTGHIVAAKSIMSRWFLYINFSAVNSEESGNIAGTEDWATQSTLIWEKQFLDILKNISGKANETAVYYEAGRSYGDISAATMFADMDKLIIGVLLMCIYVHVVLSKWNWVEQRCILGSMGLLCIGMAFVSSVGFCSMIGIPYGPVHTSLPFLLMGLGVDDMFVMMACWHKTVSPTNMKLSSHHQMGLMLKHAGTSITVTSFTDIAAFLVGASTVLPSLESFCIYAAVGVFMIYLLSITFFVACFSLDQRRVEQSRNGFFPFHKHKNYNPNKCSQNSYMHICIQWLYSNMFFTKFGKIMVILVTVCMAGFSTKNMLMLEQKFDPVWFIPESTHLYKFIQQRKEYYPDIGHEASVFMGRIDYSRELPQIIKLTKLLENATDVVNNVDSWTSGFSKYMKDNFNKDVENNILPDNEWRRYLSKYLFSPSGGKHQPKFRFVKKLECGKPVTDVIVSSINFRFKQFSESKVSISAMHKVRDIIDTVNFTTGDRFITVWGKIYGNWVTDEVIETEVMRNLGLALLCVMACTVILIGNLYICFWIFICVLCTLVNVCGFMYLWGLTIDIVSCIGLELAVGLCVDYAAHVGHTFLTMADGTQTKRALDTVTHIGAAVLFGGGSTLLALSMLSFSEAYTFKAFFKIFLLVILFGLFHGIIFLPVVLSVLGPKPVSNNTEVETKENYEMCKTDENPLSDKLIYPEVEVNAETIELH